MQAAVTALVVSRCFVEAGAVVSAGVLVVGAVPVMNVEAALHHGAGNFTSSHVTDECNVCDTNRYM